jgi:murein DD-endopeptidase MepM/ murein hydrolase activator NlpD
MYVEQGQLISYVGEPGMFDHLHFEVQMDNHRGQGWKYDTIQGIESVPAPFVEITQRPDGIPWRGDICVSQNKRFVPDKIENLRLVKGGPGLSIWPNPVHVNTDVNIECRMSNIECRSIGYEIFNLQGRLIGKHNFDIQRSLFDIRHSSTWTPSGHPAGQYIIRLTTPNRTISRPVYLLK